MKPAFRCVVRSQALTTPRRFANLGPPKAGKDGRQGRLISLLRPSPMKRLLLLSLLAAGTPARRAPAQPGGAPRPPAAPARDGAPSFPRQRTPIGRLPLEGQAEILRLETLLQQACTALAAGPTAPVFPVWRAEAVEQAAHQAAAVVPAWNQEAYRREAAFYAAEEARRRAAPKP